MFSNKTCGGYNEYIDKFWNHPAYGVYILAHLFMMPSFCFLSGLFSQSYVKRQEEPGVIQVSVANTKLQGTMMNIFMMAQLMTFFVGALRVALHYDGASLTMGERVEAVFMDDRMELWYIIALLTWRLLLPFWTCLRWELACSFLMAILPNLWGVLGQTGARTCGYFPFFMAGFMIDKGTFEAFRRDKRSQMAAIALFAVLTFLLNFRTSMQVLQDIYITTAFFDWRHLRFGFLGQPVVYYSTTFACTAAAFSLGTLVLDGSWGSVLDQMCTRSLYNYTGFMLAIILLEQFWDWSTYMNSLPPLEQMVFTMSLSFGFLMFNTCWPVCYVTSSLCEPNTKWLFKSSKPKV